MRATWDGLEARLKLACTWQVIDGQPGRVQCPEPINDLSLRRSEANLVSEEEAFEPETSENGRLDVPRILKQILNSIARLST